MLCSRICDLKGCRVLIDVFNAVCSTLFEGHGKVLNVQSERWQFGIHDEIHARFADKPVPNLMGLAFAVQP